MKIIHLSDLHIGQSSDEYEQTFLVMLDIKANYPEATILITGDITDSGTKKQFRKARGLLDSLAETNPILVVPGNHDYAWKGNIFNKKKWKNWIKYLGSPLGWSGLPIENWMGINGRHEGIGFWDDGDIIYFGIDSGDPDDKECSARGYISKKLADNLQELLIAHKGHTRVVFLHHHPFSSGGLMGYFTALEGSDNLLDAVEGNCELLLFGHKHQYGLWRDYIYEVPLVVSSHKTSSPLSGECLGYTVIDIENAGTEDVKFNHHIKVV